MTDTQPTQRIPRSPRTDAESRTPEFRLAMGALGGLRQDLFHDAFAYRPLQPRPADGPVIRRLPQRIRRYAVWTPHAFVAFVALIVLAASSTTNGLNGLVSIVFGAIPAAVVLMTLVRPVLAFWASLATSLFFGVLANPWGDWPWSGATITLHVAVLTFVAARTRPRTAMWMWLLTGAYGLAAETLLSRGYSTGSTGPLMVLSAFVLLVVAMVQVRREAREEVAVQQSVTAVERDRRTLLEERTTIARELHDVVAHHMSVVAIQAEAAPYRVENPPPELEQAFVTIRENAVAALTELRRVLGVVRAEDYEAPDAPQPTLADLDGLLGNVRDAGLEVDLAITGAVRELPQGVELSAYRIVQEALSNALRHAPGAPAKVEVSYVLGGLGLRIVNGPARGLVKPSPGAGHGITGMRERVTMLNGEMTAEQTEDGGYEVAAFLPVVKDETA